MRRSIRTVALAGFLCGTVFLPVGIAMAQIGHPKQAIEARLQEIQIEKAAMELLKLHREDTEDLVYRLMGTISPESCRKAMDSISSWSTRHPGGKLTIVLNSPGGSVVDGLALYDFIRLLPHQVTILCLGEASSMGAIILQSGGIRAMGRHAYMMIHEISWANDGKMSTMEDSRQGIAVLWDHLVGILAERSKLSAGQITERSSRKDWYLDPKEALRLGFIDEIR